jgi:hypothetical protein
MTKLGRSHEVRPTVLDLPPQGPFVLGARLSTADQPAG